MYKFFFLTLSFLSLINSSWAADQRWHGTYIQSARPVPIILTLVGSAPEIRFGEPWYCTIKGTSPMPGSSDTHLVYNASAMEGFCEQYQQGKVEINFNADKSNATATVSSPKVQRSITVNLQSSIR